MAHLSGNLNTLSEPVLRDKDVNIDDVTMGYHSTHDVVHLQLQDGMERSNNGPYLANYTCWDRNRLLRLIGESDGFGWATLPFIFNIADGKLDPQRACKNACKIRIKYNF